MKKEVNAKRINFEAQAEFWNQLQDAAKSTGMSYSELIRRSVLHYLEKLKSKEDNN